MTRLLLALSLVLGLASSTSAQQRVLTDALPTLAHTVATRVRVRVGALPPARVDHRAEWRSYFRAERRLHVARLRAYAERGQFPINDEQPGFLRVMVDDAGNLCAVAMLMAESGHRAMVDRLAAVDNSLAFGDSQDAEVLAWITESGLTTAEVARIQEPDFYMDARLPPDVQELNREQEKARLRAHLAEVASELEQNEEASLEACLAQLGDRVLESPPTMRRARAAS